jgi:hypothetical protein
MNAPLSSTRAAVVDPRYTVAGSSWPLSDEQRERLGR